MADLRDVNWGQVLNDTFLKPLGGLLPISRQPAPPPPPPGGTGAYTSRAIAGSEARREQNLADRLGVIPQGRIPGGYTGLTPSQTTAARGASTTSGGGGGGGGGPKMPSVEDMFAPLFANLEQQRRNAQSRYSANVGVIENIYGQMVGARSADIPVIEKAYQDLTQAAASRTGELTADIAAREADRVLQNQQVLASLGIDQAGAAAGDLASEQAQTAQDVAALSGTNWQNLLSGVGTVSQEMARADISGYNFRQGEDIAALNAAKEGYFQELAGQEANLLAQQEQAKFQQAQAAAEAAARAAAARANAEAKLQAAMIKAQSDQSAAAQKAAADAQSEFLKYADPLTRILITGNQAAPGLVTPQSAERMTAAYDQFVSRLGTPPQGQLEWSGPAAVAAWRTFPLATSLNRAEKGLVQQAILDLF